MTVDLKWTRLRLDNFGRWSRSGSGGPATCMSIEGRYVRERLTAEDEADRRAAREPIDMRDALLVWRAIQPTRGYPRSLVGAIWGVYVFRLSGDSLRAYLHRRHRIRIRGRDLAALVLEAEIAAHNRLTRLGVRDT